MDNRKQDLYICVASARFSFVLIFASQDQVPALVHTSAFPLLLQERTAMM